MQDILNQEELIIVKYCEKVLDLETAKLPEEYYYTSVPLCVIDAVFSIGVRYEGVKNTVKKYCRYFNLNQFREATEHPEIKLQQSVEDFLKSFNELGLTSTLMIYLTIDKELLQQMEY